MRYLPAVAMMRGMIEKQNPDDEGQQRAPNLVARMAWGAAVITAIVAVGAKQWWLLAFIVVAIAAHSVIHFVIRRIWSQR